jgi:hypothetical protein
MAHYHKSLKQLESVVGENWPWFGKYGDNLLTELISFNIPPMIPKPPQPKRTKRTATKKASEEQGGGKRQRSLPDNQAQATPTPVNNVPSSSTTTLSSPSYLLYPSPYPSTPARPPPHFSTTPIYPNPYFASYMTPAPHPGPMLYHYPVYTSPQTTISTPTPLANPANFCQVTQISQPTSYGFRHYNPESSGSSRNTNPS